jgi:macrolide transport system ATP-binding/permease protein
MMFRFEGIHKSYGYHTILHDLSGTLPHGVRMGLVGANGAGKSTLLKILAGEVAAESGTIQRDPTVRLGYLPQVVTGHDDHTLAQLIEQAQAQVTQLEQRLRTLEHAMSGADAAALEPILLAYGEAQEQYELAGGYDLQARIETVLSGLGIAHLPRDQRFGSLSGGEKARTSLALLLLAAPDVLLLDEPTNHLDVQALEWLESYLSRYSGAILVVSHDRAFLNRVVNRILEIDDHTHQGKHYSGSYDQYHAAKTLERQQWVADYARYHEERAQLEMDLHVTSRSNGNFRVISDNDKFIKGAKRDTHAATVSKRVANAAEKLKRLEANPVPQPPIPLAFNPRFDPEALKRRLPITVSELSKHYGNRCILHDVSFSVGLNSRILLRGPNGAGKSTLIRLLLGLERPDSGQVLTNPAVKIGYLAQEADLQVTGTLYEYFADGMDYPDQALKTMLIRSGLFRYDDLGKPIRGLSSGQRRKLQLARLIFGRANLLVLDEPTNDLSFDVLEALESALQDFPGPVIAASHDRRFMEHFGGAVWTLTEGRLQQG